jgi:hypothetical protein
MRSSKSGRPARHAVHLGRGELHARTPVAIAVLVAVGWIGLVGSTQPHELMVDAGVVTLLTLFAISLLRSERLELTFQLHDLLQCWRIPWYVVSGCWEITLLFLRDLLSGKRTGSYYRACSFRTNRRDPLLLARGILAVAYTTTAPNFIVIGIDTGQRQMLFHQIERSSVPKMTQSLGAQMESSS